jgi:hypothetical protein
MYTVETETRFLPGNYLLSPGPPPPTAFDSPSRPLAIPTPMPPEGFVPSEELDAEYMTVDPEEDFEGWHGGQDSYSQWRRPGFVCGSLVG